MRVAICFIALFFAASNLFADTLTFELTTDKTEYLVGDTVTWQTFVTASNFSQDNFGAQALGFDLAESRFETLGPASPGPAFTDYNFLLGASGIPNGNGPGTLANVAIGQFGYVPTVVELTSASPGPTLMSQGSFVITQEGEHTLTLTSDPSQFFTTNVGGGTSGRAYDPIVGATATFTAAVPEPSSVILSLLCVGSTLGLAWRRRAKAKAAQQAEEEQAEA